MFCQEYTIAKEESNRVNLFPLRCKCWHCQECAPINAAKVKRKAKRGRPERLLTLTTTPAFEPDPNLAARHLVTAFRQLIRKIRADHPNKDLQYFAVFERTKNGMPHLHVLMRGPWIDQKWISNFMRETIDAPIVDIRSVSDDRKAIEYVCKYASKSPHRYDHCQRFWSSRAYDLGKGHPLDENPAIPKGNWLIIREDTFKVAWAFELEGFAIEEGPFGGFVAWNNAP